VTITINPDATITILPNPQFIQLIGQEFGNNKGQALITMCRSGNRSTRAAELLEMLGFTHVFEMDNALAEENSYPGGFGGLQGASYGGAYDGYRGYPGRLPPRTGNPVQIGVGIDTDRIQNEQSSVSWMDTGLPITQDLSKAIIPVPNP
jgi:rhodanese-related sulfurtransferase